MIPIYKISLPEYIVDARPDWVVLGVKVDDLIKKEFFGRHIALRCLCMSDHPGKSVDEIIQIIQELGTDRYDPMREGDRYDNVENKKIDIFALDYVVKEKTKMMGNMIRSFYVYPIEYGKDPSRIDIVMVYDADKLECVPHQYEGRDDIKTDGFVFKCERKEALLAIVVLLS